MGLPPPSADEVSAHDRGRYGLPAAAVVGGFFDRVKRECDRGSGLVAKLRANSLQLIA